MHFPCLNERQVKLSYPFLKIMCKALNGSGATWTTFSIYRNWCLSAAFQCVSCPFLCRTHISPQLRSAELKTNYVLYSIYQCYSHSRKIYYICHMKKISHRIVLFWFRLFWGFCLAGFVWFWGFWWVLCVLFCLFVLIKGNFQIKKQNKKLIWTALQLEELILPEAITKDHK